MQMLHSADDVVLIGYLKSLLEAEGIACNVRNELLSGGSGELPVNECWPELWVLDDDDVVAAQGILSAALSETQVTYEDWTCGHCGEKSEGQFNACWQCGALRR